MIRPILATLVLPVLCLAQTPLPVDAIRTPAAPLAPRVNGPRVYGARPGHPFFYHLPVTGQRPITVSAEGLPSGLSLDPATGNITGMIASAGEYPVTFTASNTQGKGAATIRLVIGPTVCLTPPLGWNSWNCFHGGIDEPKIRAAAEAMVKTGLIDHGWTYINMDDRWEGGRDAAGNIQGSAKFPDMKRLADSVHAMGLKIGLYSSPGPFTCAHATGSYQHEDQDAATYAGWGMDYLKYDWCSYGAIAASLRLEEYAKLLPPKDAGELKSLGMEESVLQLRGWNQDPSVLPSSPEMDAIRTRTATLTKEQAQARLKEIEARAGQLEAEARKLNPASAAGIEVNLDKQPYQKMRASLDKVDRDIIFSFCQYGMGKVWEWGAQTGGNLWRTTGDISSSWKSVEDHGFNQNGLQKWGGPGHWNDPDMLEIGNGNMTPDENYTHMTLWCMLDAPLLIGCDMPKMSPFTVSLFSNDEVLAVNQDALGRQGWRAKQEGRQEVWMKPLEGGAMAVAFFNRADAPGNVSITWSDLGLSGPQALRDLWRQKDLGVQPTGYSMDLATHGAELFKLMPAK